MPIGCLSCVSPVANGLAVARPKSVLDLGAGMGLYGAVVRQWLDNGVRPWTTRLVGVEGWAEYRNPTWDLYDEFHVEAIEAFLDRVTETFDAILLMDVLEHFDRAAGERVIARCIVRLSAGGKVWIATPAVWMEQGAAHGNELECHRSLWTAEDFAKLGFAVLTDGAPDEFGNRMLLACYLNEQTG